MAYKTYRGKRLRACFFCALAFLIIIFAIVTMLRQTKYTKDLEKSYELKDNELSELKQNKERFVYVTNRDINAGEPICSTDVSYESVYSSMDECLFASVGEEYMVSLVDMPKGTHLLNSMVSMEAIDANIREEEFNVFYLSKNLTEYDVVDVRIFYPNGENYIVLSKKILRGIHQETANCLMWLDEQETLLISSAIVDAYLIPGTYLYTTKYVESAIQDASIVTYTPSKETIDLIQKSPNILELAKRILSKKVRESMELRTDLFIKEKGEEKEIEAFPEFVNQGIASKIESEPELEQEPKEEEEITYVD